MKTTSNKEKRIQRHKRIRSQVKGTAARPRLSVFRSNRYVWAQLVDDENGRTLASVSSRESAPASKSKKSKTVGRTAAAAVAGEKIAGMAAAKEIGTVVFDRGGYRYHGIIKAIAEGARKGGLRF